MTDLNNHAYTTGKSNVTLETVYLLMIFCDILLDTRRTQLSHQTLHPMGEPTRDDASSQASDWSQQFEDLNVQAFPPIPIRGTQADVLPWYKARCLTGSGNLLVLRTRPTLLRILSGRNSQCPLVMINGFREMAESNDRFEMHRAQFP